MNPSLVQVDRQCKVCGTIYQGIKSSKYCSKECRIKRQIERQEDGRRNATKRYQQIVALYDDVGAQTDLVMRFYTRLEQHMIPSAALQLTTAWIQVQNWQVEIPSNDEL